jgi:hypothetical protein
MDLRANDLIVQGLAILFHSPTASLSNVLQLP